MINTAPDQPKVYVIHENEAWLPPLRNGFEKHGIPYDEWFIHEGKLDLGAMPPEGIFYNRMSASSHTRDHRYAVELTGPILAWLELHGRKVVNGRRAVQLEARKVEQYLALQRHDIPYPYTIAAVGKEQILSAAKYFEGRKFILKPNRGGKGLGVQLMENKIALERFLIRNPLESFTLDGLVLLQEYIKPADGTITRMEFIGGKFYYAVQVDTSNGFELCPAVECEIGDLACPAEPGAIEETPRFRIIEDFHIPEIEACEDFLQANDIEVAGIEFSRDENGNRYFYDVNTNTNYNDIAEVNSPSGKKGMDQIAQYLGKLLHSHAFAPAKQA